MANNLPNLYSPNLSGMDPQTARTIRDLTERINYLTTELDNVKGGMPDHMSTMARRESPQPGVITIPARNNNGIDGFVRVSPDGVITSYSNPSESIFPYLDLRVIGNVGAGVDVLHSFTIPAGTLAFDGDYLKVRYKGDFANNANTKRIQGVIGGFTYNNTGLYSIGAAEWVWDIDVIRVSPTQIRLPIIAMDGFGDRTLAGVNGGNYLFFSAGNLATVTNLNTTDVVMEMQAESGASATDDIIQRVSRIEFYRPRTVRLI